MPTELYIHVDSYTDMTTEADQDDEWSRDSTSTEHYFRGIYLNDGLDRKKEIVPFDVKNGDTVWALHAQWSTGDSFGTDDGECHDVIGIYKTYEEAKADKNLIDEQEKRFRKTNNFTKDSFLTLSNGTNFSIPWLGYFESLDWMRIDSFEVV